MVSPLKAWDTLCKNDLIAAVSIRKSSCVIVIATAAQLRPCTYHRGSHITNVGVPKSRPKSPGYFFSIFETNPPGQSGKLLGLSCLQVPSFFYFFCSHAHCFVGSTHAPVNPLIGQNPMFCLATKASTAFQRLDRAATGAVSRGCRDCAGRYWVIGTWTERIMIIIVIVLVIIIMIVNHTY